jgi:hypothetical protein
MESIPSGHESPEVPLSSLSTVLFATTKYKQGFTCMSLLSRASLHQFRCTCKVQVQRPAVTAYACHVDVHMAFRCRCIFKRYLAHWFSSPVQAANLSSQTSSLDNNSFFCAFNGASQVQASFGELACSNCWQPAQPTDLPCHCRHVSVHVHPFSVGSSQQKACTLMSRACTMVTCLTTPQRWL